MNFNKTIQNSLKVIFANAIFDTWDLNRLLRKKLMPSTFYRSKMILDRPNCFGRVQVLLLGSKGFGQVQIILLRFKLDFSRLIFIIWTFQNALDPTETNHFGHNEGQGISVDHKSFESNFCKRNS